MYNNRVSSYVAWRAPEVPTMLTKRPKTASQIEFNDPEVTHRFKSLYLDTLGTESVRRNAVSPTRSKQAADSSSVEGYIHGTLSTAGINGASPAVHSLTKQAAKAIAQQGHHGFQAAAAASAAAEAADSQVASPSADTDPGMRPKQRHPALTNRPDLAHSTLDIDGAQSHSRSILKAPRNTDPLNPKYQLPASVTLPLPSGSPPPDKLLSDPLKVADIPGATRKPPPPSSSRPGQLDVSDIEGSNAQWKSQHRQQVHTASKSRTAGLDVRDINTYMARFRPGPRSPLEKGHPGGPKLQPQIKPRHNPAFMDNSLRTLDIEGTKAVLSETRIGARQPHNHTTSVADIEGAAPADRDRVRLFERKSAAAAVIVADHEAAQAVLSGLSLEPPDLATLWKTCSSLDRDNSGYLTAAELQSAMQSACLKLSQADTQQLLSALKDNAGLLNYKKLTQQLKGRVSRPCSAKQPQREPPQTAAGAQKVQQEQQQQQQQQQVQPDIVSQVAETLQDTEHAATAANATESDMVRTIAAAVSSAVEGLRAASHVAASTNSVGALSGFQQQRPHTAPVSKFKSAGNGSAGSSPGENFKGLSHWFGGSRRDATAAQEGANWRPGQDVELMIGRSVTPDSSILTPWVLASGGGGGSSNSLVAGVTPQQEIGCSFCKQQRGVTWNLQTRTSQGPDVVPGWVIGADPVHGTCKVVQPFGADEQREGGQGAGRAAVEAASCMQDAASSTCSAAVRPTSAASAAGPSAAGYCSTPGTHSSRGATPTASQPAVAAAPSQRRPASAGPCCGRSSSRTSDGSSTSGLAGSVVGPTVAKTVDRKWNANGFDHRSTLGAHHDGGISRSVSSHWLLGGGSDEVLLHRQRQYRGIQQKQRPHSASAVRTQRPSTAQPAIQHSPAAVPLQNSLAATQHSPAAAVDRAVTGSHHNAVPFCAGTGFTISRPVSAMSGSPLLIRPCSIGLAERQRLIESMQHDLTAVRLLQ